MLPPYGSRWVPVQHDPKWLEQLRRRKEIIERLCGALRDFLCDDIDRSLQQAETATPPQGPTIDDLESAQRQRECLQSQIKTLNRLIAELPDANAAYMREFQLKPLEEQLRHADNWLSQMQAEIEKSAGLAESSTSTATSIKPKE